MNVRTTRPSLSRLALVSALLFCFCIAASAQVPSSQHVVLIIDENHSYSDVLANMPWLVSQGNANGYATNYHSDNAGSLLDYLWLASGSCESSLQCTLPPGTNNFGCDGNHCPSPITDDNIFREMNNRGITWKVYAQSYAAAGGTVTTPDNANSTPYYRRHNGATWYSDILSNVNNSQANVVDFTRFATDLNNGTLPRFSIVIPDGLNDAHDGTLAQADSFLNTNISPMLAKPYFQAGGDGLLIVTFDECASSSNTGCGAQVYTAVIGPNVTAHTVSSTSYKHENTLRTILDALNITTYPGAAASASPMLDFFGAGQTGVRVTVGTPAPNSNVTSPVAVSASATSSHTITSWKIYVDNVQVYSAGQQSSISTSLTIAGGTHTMIVRAWDSTGAFGDQTLSITVGSGASGVTVTVSSPANGATVSSPTTISASASSSHAITGWHIYVDNVDSYSAGAVTSINASVTMSAGAHTVIVRAWDSTGAFGDQTLTLTVSSSGVVVNVSTPANNASVTSPVAVSASATSSHTITGWKIYVDNVQAYSAGQQSSISTSLTIAAGTHTMIVRAWDSTGAFGDKTLTITVQ